MEYFIVELQGKSKVQHGSTFSSAEANEKAAQIQRRTGNPVNVNAEYVSSNQIDDDAIGFFQYPLTAEEIFKRSHGDQSDYHSQPFEIKRAYEACVAAGNEAIGEYVSGIFQLTNNSEGQIS